MNFSNTYEKINHELNGLGIETSVANFQRLNEHNPIFIERIRRVDNLGNISGANLLFVY